MAASSRKVGHGSFARFTLLMALAIVLSANLIGCGGSGGSKADAAAKSETVRNWVVLVDLSGSTKPDRAEYVQFYKDIVGRLGRGDSIIVYDVSKDSVINGKPLAQTRIDRMPAPKDPNMDSVVLESQTQKWEEENPIEDFTGPLTSSEVLGQISTSDSGGSDIFGALRLASRQFQVAEGEPMLVVMSDMQANSSVLNMYGKEFMNPKFDVDKWIVAHKGDEALPDLTGARVLVVGAGGKDTAAYDRARRFWLKYFPAVGAVLSEAYYGHDLPLSVLDGITASGK